MPYSSTQSKNRTDSKAESRAHGLRKMRMPAAGFTLVETLVAISILLIALTGPLAIIAQSLKSSYYARDEITAAYLAQEPVEYIRNLRDQNGLRSSDASHWLDDIYADKDGNQRINSPGSTAKKFNLVRTADGYDLIDCSNSLTGCSVNYDSTTGLYGDADGINGDDSHSIFTREVYLSESASDAGESNGAVLPTRELVITVVVSWHTGSIGNNVTIQERLTNWQLESQT